MQLESRGEEWEKTWKYFLLVRTSQFHGFIFCPPFQFLAITQSLFWEEHKIYTKVSYGWVQPMQDLLENRSRVITASVEAVVFQLQGQRETLLVHISSTSAPQIPVDRRGAFKSTPQGAEQYQTWRNMLFSFSYSDNNTNILSACCEIVSVPYCDMTSWWCHELQSCQLRSQFWSEQILTDWEQHSIAAFGFGIK